MVALLTLDTRGSFVLYSPPSKGSSYQFLISLFPFYRHLGSCYSPQYCSANLIEIELHLNAVISNSIPFVKKGAEGFLSCRCSDNLAMIYNCDHGGWVCEYHESIRPESDQLEPGEGQGASDRGSVSHRQREDLESSNAAMR